MVKISSGKTALDEPFASHIHSAISDLSRLIKLLVEMGPDVNVKIICGVETPRHRSSGRCSIEPAELMTDENATKDKDGRAPLYVPCEKDG